MTLKALLSIGLAAAALAVGVQAASASPQDASDRAKPRSATAPSDAFERSASEKRVLKALAHLYRDAHHSESADSRGAVETAPSDSVERSAIVTQRSTGAVLAGDSHGRVDVESMPAPVTSATSGRELEWPQIGVGFGVGILLAFGVMLAARATRVRSLAH